jgi:hypothetical protein
VSCARAFAEVISDGILPEEQTERVVAWASAVPGSTPDFRRLVTADLLQFQFVLAHPVRGFLAADPEKFPAWRCVGLLGNLRDAFGVALEKMPDGSEASARAAVAELMRISTADLNIDTRLFAKASATPLQAGLDFEAKVRGARAALRIGIELHRRVSAGGPAPAGVRDILPAGVAATPEVGYWGIFDDGPRREPVFRFLVPDETQPVIEMR